MPLAAGTRMGPYEIVSPLGKGGMGEVYRARDTALNRDVAIKIRPASLGEDADLVARFEREAQVLASLNHPNIAQIYALAPAPDGGNAVAIVMELVDGDTLADIIAARELRLTDALNYARQIADGLDAAHGIGIVHRDLKPSNISVRKDGTVKVLDFGLAKVLEAAAGTPPPDAPTAILATQPGLVVGTARYMSPEQARGDAVDKRTDIWAFGCVLYEMLARRHPFTGQTMADTIAGILTREPDWSALPPSTPVAVRKVLTRCLEKDPRLRLRDIADVRAELAESAIASAPAAAQPSPAGTPPAFAWWKLGAAAAAGGAIALAAAALAMKSAAPTPAAAATRLSLGVPGQFFTQPPSAVISPDGRMVAFVATDDAGHDLLWIRSLDAQDARALAGTERADQLFWSPDCRFVGFFADGELKTIAIADGHVQTLTKAPVTPGATWNESGTILFAQGTGTLKTISMAGGEAAAVQTPPGSLPRWPHFLPDGRHFVYFDAAPGQKSGVYLGSLDGAKSERLLDSDFEAVYAPPGYLLFVRDETLFAQPFDASARALSGTAQAIASGVWVARGYGHGAFSVAGNGTVAYVNAAIANTQLAWFDGSGRPLGTLGPPGRYDSPPQIAPNGSAVAVARGPYAMQDIWTWDTTSGTSTRFTFDHIGSRGPVWLRDGSRLLFQSPRGDGETRVYARNANGSGADERASETRVMTLQDVSADGRSVVYTAYGKSGRAEVWMMPLSGGAGTPVLQTDASNGQAQISPDGKWIAYVSNESGREEVFVQSFPQTGSKRQVSEGGGAQPRWRRNGGALFYLAPDRSLMSVPVQAGSTLQIGRPSALFRTRLEFLGLQGPLFMAGYDVTPDGEKFLLNAPSAASGPPIDVILNWTALLKK